MSFQPTCRSCRIRFYVKDPAAKDVFAPLMLDKREIRWLENAARVFDEYSGERRFTAAEFLAWIAPDLTGRGRAPLLDHDGRSLHDTGPQGHWPPRAA